MSRMTHSCTYKDTHTYTQAVPGVFLSSTHTIVTPEPCRLGEPQTKSSFCLLPVNPIWLLAVAQLHYYLPTALNEHRLLNKVAEGESEISFSGLTVEAGWQQLKGQKNESERQQRHTHLQKSHLNCFL